VADGRYRPAEQWLDGEGQRFSPYTHYCVGGNTKMFGAALLRLRESDFTEVRHHGGVSPAWPIAYADLEPYYGQAEHLYSVHGARGTDPCEPSASTPYPHPALDHEPGIRELFADLTEHGARPFPLPVGIRLPPPGDGQRGASPVRPSRFDGYPDPTEAKADAHVVALSPALQRENVHLLTRARAERLVTDAAGRRVTGVVVERDGALSTLSADLVVVACGAINSAALLLRSGGDRHPQGLANSSGQVGRNYMAHNNGALVAVTRRENGARFQKTLALTDYYRAAPDLPLGCVQMMGRRDESELAGLLAPGHPEIDARTAIHGAFEFWLTAEDLPDPENRVTLAADGSIVLNRRPSNREAYDRLKGRLIALLDRVFAKDGGATYVGYDLGIGGVSHQCGTLRFGTDPGTSVLDLHCRAHDLDNLNVVDGSFFPASGAVNPALTIAANALRVGEHLAARLGRDRP